MKIFLDTSKIEEMRKWSHIIDGVTTNPSILQKEGGNIEDICTFINPLPISIESGGNLYREAMELWEWLRPSNSNLAIKIPFLNPNGLDNLKIIDSLIQEGLSINCTAVLSLSQCILASKLGCRYISVFGGRIEDEGGDFFDVVSKCQDYLYNTLGGQELIVGSIRTIGNVETVAKAKADIITVPPKILQKMTQHKYAQFTSKQFEDDYVSVVALKGLKDTQKALEIPHPVAGT